MKLQMYAVYDRMVEAYMQPFFVRSRGEAVRMWKATVNEANSNFGKHAKDYACVYIGDWDDSSGVVDCNVEPFRLGAEDVLDGPEVTHPFGLQRPLDV